VTFKENYLYKKISIIFFTRNFLLFLIFGTSTFLLDYILYFYFLDQGFSLNTAKASSSFVAVLFNYLLNSKYNFNAQIVFSLRYIFLYLCIYGILILLHVIINSSLFTLLQNAKIAVLLAMSASVVINYLCIKTFFAYIKK